MGRSSRSGGQVRLLAPSSTGGLGKAFLKERFDCNVSGLRRAGSGPASPAAFYQRGLFRGKKLEGRDYSVGRANLPGCDVLDRKVSHEPLVEVERLQEPLVFGVEVRLAEIKGARLNMAPGRLPFVIGVQDVDSGCHEAAWATRAPSSRAWATLRASSG